LGGLACDGVERKRWRVYWERVPFFFFSVVLALVLRVVVFSLGIVVFVYGTIETVDDDD